MYSIKHFCREGTRESLAAESIVIAEFFYQDVSGRRSKAFNRQANPGSTEAHTPLPASGAKKGGNVPKISYYDLEEIQEEFLKYAPAYAHREAQQALDKVLELQKQGIIRDGLYYIVLVDLVASTDYGVRHGNEKLALRIERFVMSSFNALNDSKIRNVALFIKEIGDAVLYIFQHFPDVLLWNAKFREWLRTLGDDDEPINIRTCVHIGEVFLQGVNPLSLAVSQTFKMEKQVDSNQVVLTEPAYNVAWPTIARAYHGFTKTGSIQMDGFASDVGLYKLEIHDEQDLERMAKESLE
jgi:class 3 adenylate cyclase